jgi:hypothetical protein
MTGLFHQKTKDNILVKKESYQRPAFGIGIGIC